MLVPADIRSKFQEIAKCSDIPNLNSEANKARLLQLIGEVLEITSPE